MKPYVVAGIFARGSSKAVPHKNIRLVAGKPLISYAIETARRSPLVDRVIVSTDDEEIARISLQCGAEVPFMRPAELAQDDSPEWLSWQHAVRVLGGDPHQGGTWDAFVSVPATSPLRNVNDLDACIAALLEGDSDGTIAVRPAERNPHFNMVSLDEQGFARIVCQTQPPISRRQDAPAVYDMTTVAFALRPAFLLEATSLFQGRIRAVVVPTERALDIDTEHDLRVAECLLRHAGESR